MQVDPLLVLVMTGLGYIAYVFLSPTLNPFARSRRGARRRHIRFAQLVGLFLTLSWLITLFFPMTIMLENLPARVGISLLASLVPIGILCTVVMFSSWRTGRAAASEQKQSDDNDMLVASDFAERITGLHIEPDVALELDPVDEPAVQALEDNLTPGVPFLQDAVEMPAEQAEQMGRVSELMDNYELDDNAEDDLDATSMIHDVEVELPGQRPITAHRSHDAVDVVERTNGLATVPGDNDKQMQLAELASSNVKLKKLVIAQQAVIDSEKKSHNKTRIVARRAVEAARQAIEGRKTAEKMARREAAERQRATLKAREATAALKNALSVLARERNARSPQES